MSPKPIKTCSKCHPNKNKSTQCLKANSHWIISIMTVHIGHDEGVCGECKRYKTDLYKGYCQECRSNYGKRSDHTKWKAEKDQEKAEYRAKIERGEIDPSPAPRAKTAEREQLDHKIEYVYLKTAIIDLMLQLDKVGYSSEDAMNNWRHMGEMREPFKTIEKVKKLLERTI